MIIDVDNSAAAADEDDDHDDDDDDDDDDDAFQGGVREAFFSNEYYSLVWGKRIGFAKVAREAQVVSCH